MRLYSLTLLGACLACQHAPAGAAPNAACGTTQCTATYVQCIMPKVAGLTFEKAVHVPQNGSFGEAAAQDQAYAYNATHLPELCAASFKYTDPAAAGTSEPSSYRFGLFLPAKNWNGKLLTVGNGGFGGGINWPEMGQAPHYNMSAMSTDTGHNSPSSVPASNPNLQILNWALNKPGAQRDWGKRAVNGSLALAKLIVPAYYQQSKLTRSYYASCSTGGRQGLKQIQIDPTSFDGLLIGAPAWDEPGLTSWAAREGYLNFNKTTNQTILNAAQFTILSNAIISQCDGLDGVSDRIVSRPDLCAARFNFANITCGVGASPPNCLTQAQVDIAKATYADYHLNNGAGRLVHEGFEYGSEESWSIYLDSQDFDAEYERYFLFNDTRWQVTQYNDSVAEISAQTNNGEARADKFKLDSVFKGKIIMYHGTADGLIPTRASQRYYTSTQTAYGGTVDDWFRHFVVPGMQHCAFTASDVNAPWAFGAAGQASVIQALPLSGIPVPDSFAQGWSTPGFIGQLQFDALLKMMNWVENGSAPDSITAVAYNADFSVNRTRPLCPYPRVAVLNSGAQQDDWRSWTCTSPPSAR